MSSSTILPSRDSEPHDREWPPLANGDDAGRTVDQNPLHRLVGPRPQQRLVLSSMVALFCWTADMTGSAGTLPGVVVVRAGDGVRLVGMLRRPSWVVGCQRC
jgi:hypothetical protein